MGKDKFKALRSCHLFRNTSPDSIAPLVQASCVESRYAGEPIFAAADEADGLRVVLSGQVRIWLANSEGRELTLSLLGPGDAFGEIALLDGLPRTANASCIDATDCLFLPKKALQAALERDTSLAQALIHSLCELLRQNLDTLSGFAFAALDKRLAAKLHELALDHALLEGRTARFSRRFPQTELAQLLGVTREAVNKRFKVLEHDGLVSQDGGYLVVHDLAALAERASFE